MTEEQVCKLLDTELMTKGVAKVAAPVLPELELLEVPKQVFYAVGPCLFERVEDAEACRKLSPMEEVQDYSFGYGGEGKYPRRIESGIVHLMLPLHETLIERKAAILRNKEKGAVISKLQSQFEKDAKAMDDTLKGVWGDWYERREAARGHMAILDTFAEYTKLADGDQTIAMQFLLKLHTAEQIAAAREWFGEKTEETNG